MTVYEDEWDDLEAPVRKAPGPPPLVDVAFAIGAPTGRSSSAFRPWLYATGDVLRTLGMETWRARVRAGRGGEAGRLAVIPDPDGPFEWTEIVGPRASTGTGNYRMRLPMLERFPAAVIERQERPFEVAWIGGNRVLFVTLPPCCLTPELKAREESKYRAKAAKPLAITDQRGKP